MSDNTIPQPPEPHAGGQHTAGLEPEQSGQPSPDAGALRRRSVWRRNRIPLAVGAVAVVFAAVGLTVGNELVIAPQVATATSARCTAAYDGSAARAACRAGDEAGAKTKQAEFTAAAKKKALVASCHTRYTDITARIECVGGDTTSADADQAKADAAAAAAERLASQGQSADNPAPAGAHASMQSTNRIDGTTVTYDEWVNGFNTDWRGYDEFSAPDEDHKYISFLVHVKADDSGVDASSVAYDASFTDSHGNVYSQSDDVYDAKPEMPDVTLGADQKAKGIVVFEVPDSVTSGVATIGDGSVFLALKK